MLIEGSMKYTLGQQALFPQATVLVDVSRLQLDTYGQNQLPRTFTGRKKYFRHLLYNLTAKKL